MISEEKQDLAVDYVLDSLEAAAARALEAELKTDGELRAFVKEVRDAAAAMAHDAPEHQPPPGLRGRVLSIVSAESSMASLSRQTPVTTGKKESGGFAFLPWAIAAGFAITTAALWTERDQWKKEALWLRSEALALRERDAFSQMRIAMLTAQNEAYAKGAAVVVWDSGKQRGVIRLLHFPAAESGRDYQLWVIDPRYPQPVSAGVLPVDADGFARVSFSPSQPIGKADKFAISVEPQGGSITPAGPIILAGD